MEPGYKTKGFDGVERSGQDQLFLGCPRTGVKADSEVLVFVLGGVGSASLDFVGSWMETLILFPWQRDLVTPGSHLYGSSLNLYTNLWPATYKMRK